MMRRLLIALMALVMIGGVAGVSQAAQDDGPSRGGPKEEGNCSNNEDDDGDGDTDEEDAGCTLPGCIPSGQQPNKCFEEDADHEDCEGIGDADQDGICDDVDDCDGDNADSDGDGICNGEDDCDGDNADSDGDGVCNGEDDCPADPQNDADDDGVCGNVDNCPSTPNSDQANTYGDARGDACEPEPGACDDLGGDTDNDGICDNDDECPADATNDADNDGVCGGVDNCPSVSNPDQENTYGDARGDACEPRPAVNKCTAGSADPGLLTPDTLGQTLWDAGLQLSPLTEDPEGDGPLSGVLRDAGNGQPFEVLTDELGCAVDLLFDGAALGVDL